jgi:hypothetical protein
MPLPPASNLFLSTQFSNALNTIQKDTYICVYPTLDSNTCTECKYACDLLYYFQRPGMMDACLCISTPIGHVSPAQIPIHEVSHFVLKICITKYEKEENNA